MSSQDFDLYRFRFEQMDSVRNAHRDARRFFTTLHIGGISSLLSLQGQMGAAGAPIIVGASIGLTLMCVVWHTTSTHAARTIKLRAAPVLDLEARLGFSYLKDEFWALHRMSEPPRFAFDRAFAVVLGAAYVAIAVLFGGADLSGLRDALAHIS